MENASDWLSRFLVPETVSPVQIIIGTSPSKKQRLEKRMTENEDLKPVVESVKALQ